MKYILLLSLVLIGCVKNIPEKSVLERMSDIEKNHYSKLSDEEKILINDCVTAKYNGFSYSYCIKQLRENKNTNCNNSSLGSAAVGAVVGYGAAKLLSKGKK